MVTTPKPAVPPEQPAPLRSPPNLKHAIAQALHSAKAMEDAMLSTAETATTVLNILADPGAAAATALGGMVDEKMSQLVSGMGGSNWPIPSSYTHGARSGNSPRARQAPAEWSTAAAADPPYHP
jgi:hypothetical protein